MSIYTKHSSRFPLLFQSSRIGTVLTTKTADSRPRLVIEIVEFVGDRL